jgi:hypothetical protein
MAADRMRPVRREHTVRREGIVDRDLDREIDETHLAPVPDVWVTDQVHWGPVVGGFLAGLTSLILLSMLGIALGITAVNPATTAAQGTVPTGAAWGSLIWAGAASLISYFIGGYIAGRSSGTLDRGWGALNGAMVFMLSIPFTLWLGSMGLGVILGGLGSFVGSLTAAYGVPTVNPNAVNPQAVATTAEAIRNTALGTFIGGVLGLIFATSGGMIGTRSEVDI